MKKLVLALFSFWFFVGCANQPLTGSHAGDNTLIGAGAGAGIGAAIAGATGFDPGIGAAIGGVLGGATGYYMGQQRDLEIAKLKAQQWSSQGFETKAIPSAQPITVQAADGSKEQQQGLERVDVDLPAKMIKSKSPALNQLLIDAGRMQAESTYRYMYKISANSQSDYQYIVSQIKLGSPQKEVFASFEPSSSPKLTMQVL